MPYDPTQELRALKEMLSTAEKIFDALKKLIPASTAEQNWLQWRLEGSQRQLDDLNRQMRHLVNEMQEAMFRQDSALLLFKGDVCLHVNPRGVPVSQLPFKPEDRAGKDIKKVLEGERLAKWIELWEESRRQGTGRVEMTLPSNAGTMMKYYYKAIYKPVEGEEERHVYIRPSPIGIRLRQSGERAGKMLLLSSGLLG